MNNFDVLLGMKLGGGGGSSTLVEKTITANGTYNPADDNADGYSSVTANVPNTYTLSDEGKVVDNGALVSQTSRQIISNNTYNTTLNNEVVVNVPNTYDLADEGKVVSSGALVSQTAYSSTIVTNGTYDTTLNNSVTVDVPPTPAETKSVVFYDYDGTVLYSYTPTEFAALTEMPANPTHEGLTAQGWNWNLADAKTYVDECGALDIGQLYDTADGKTRIYFTLVDGYLNPYVAISVSTAGNIDWGDGTTTAVVVGDTNIPHVYASSGDYVITLDAGIKLYTYKHSSHVCSILNSGNRDAASISIYAKNINRVELGSSQTNTDTLFNQAVSLTTVILPSALTSLGFYCLNGTNISHLTIPNNCYIDERCIYDCSVKTISFGHGSRMATNAYGNPVNNAIDSCKFLIHLNLPTAVNGLNSMDYMYSLEYINAPMLSKWEGVDGACNLKRLYTPRWVGSWYRGLKNAYSLSDLTLKSSGTFGSSSTIINGVFQYNTQIKRFDFSNVSLYSQQYLSHGFEYCTGLQNIKLFSNQHYVGTNCFAYCYVLTEVTMPNTVTSIGDYAFYNCYNLKTISDTSSVTSIAQNAFTNCTQLTTIDLSSVTSIGQNAFYNCNRITSVTLPNISTINSYAFRYNRGLATVTIGSAVTSIATNAFADCDALTTITINKAEGSISGAPWGALNATVVWTG